MCVCGCVCVCGYDGSITGYMYVCVGVCVWVWWEYECRAIGGGMRWIFCVDMGWVYEEGMYGVDAERLWRVCVE